MDSFIAVVDSIFDVRLPPLLTVLGQYHEFNDKIHYGKVKKANKDTKEQSTVKNNAVVNNIDLDLDARKLQEAYAKYRQQLKPGKKFVDLQMFEYFRRELKWDEYEIKLAQKLQNVKKIYKSQFQYGSISENEALKRNYETILVSLTRYFQNKYKIDLS